MVFGEVGTLEIIVGTKMGCRILLLMGWSVGSWNKCLNPVSLLTTTIRLLVEAVKVYGTASSAGTALHSQGADARLTWPAAEWIGVLANCAGSSERGRWAREGTSSGAEVVVEVGWGERVGEDGGYEVEKGGAGGRCVVNGFRKMTHDEPEVQGDLEEVTHSGLNGTPRPGIRDQGSPEIKANQLLVSWNNNSNTCAVIRKIYQTM